ncbi:lipid-A-disaccharide synthase [Rhodoplanes sp. TEM]|uniref:Lipid-A-disaccharide synthase n=1 Tax=Rhodoplanes tepidamans TaxID=200616 RepID=A0ABT5J9U2_RHOTP|nr:MULTISPECIES: lipid-A-disaccharide synthase [Rhodoplanes]MDC7786414.1 lipid-A-disaccharide synthase [Rhodoplanes tepidamans]MDC7985744.1 lipid-A-disaccharide synthase [Rhodoplanes sp. TEM]MDQ0357299.1 lipid-A-disaccharide synthase [Rhodoplanes tepidamans]
MSTAGPTIAVVATEASGDRLGGGLMQALRARVPDARFVGLGGPDMIGQGLHSLFPIDELAIIGITAILSRLPELLGRIGSAADAIVAAKPDVLVIVDSPEFTHRVAKRVRRALPDLPVVDYVSPSVWAWRPGRARAMAAYVDHVLALLPFEPAAHRRLGGPACTYVGHPLAAEAALLRPGPAEAARREASPPVLLVLPGSRGGELARHAQLFGDALARLVERRGPVDAVLPTPPHLSSRVKDATAGWSVQPRIVATPEEKWAAFRGARAALAASGTVTLELAVAGVPTVVAYKVPLIEELIARAMIKVPSIVLANLVLGENVMPELVQRAATPETLAAALAPLLADTPERRGQVTAFATLDAIMQIGTAQPSERAADIVLAEMRRRSAGRQAPATG